ncbi:hypothetical protein [Corynebacterium argentoratense]
MAPRGFVDGDVSAHLLSGGTQDHGVGIVDRFVVGVGHQQQER